MKSNWIKMAVVALGAQAAMWAQAYQPQDPNYYPDDQRQYSTAPNSPYDGQYGRNPAYNQGYDPNYDPNYGSSYGPNYGPNYDPNYGYQAPPPPPPPAYAYSRPPMPGPGYLWVDGYWGFYGGRYAWTRGYWRQPPYAGGYWVAPRYSGGRFFAGFWAGPRGGGYVRGPAYRAPYGRGFHGRR